MIAALVVLALLFCATKFGQGLVTMAWCCVRAIILAGRVVVFAIAGLRRPTPATTEPVVLQAKVVRTTTLLFAPQNEVAKMNKALAKRYGPALLDNPRVRAGIERAAKG